MSMRSMLTLMMILGFREDSMKLVSSEIVTFSFMQNFIRGIF